MAESSTTAVLVCPSCSAPVALREGETAPCAHCQASVEIPEAHRKLRAIQRRDARAQAEAENLARALVPAGRTLTALAWLVDYGGYVYWVTLLSVFTLAPALALWTALWAGRHLIGIDPIDVFGATGTLVLSFGTVVALIGVVPIAASLGRRRAAFRLALTQSLAARRTQDSAELACRNCGAPLELETSELVERCVYCNADNLRLPDLPTLRQQQAQSRAFRATLAEAAKDDAAERAEVRRVLRRRIYWTVIAVLPFAALGVFLDIALLSDPNTKPHWLRAAYAHRRPLLLGWCYGDRQGERGMTDCDPQVWQSSHKFTLPATLGLPAVGELKRHASCQLPLRKGERVRIRWRPDPAIPPVSVTVKLEEQEVLLGPGASAELRVPWHGWHTLLFTGPGDTAGQLEIGLD